MKLILTDGDIELLKTALNEIAEKCEQDADRYGESFRKSAEAYSELLEKLESADEITYRWVK
jgi:hypothetical protein